MRRKRILKTAAERRLDRQHHQRCRDSSRSFYQYFENKEDLYYYYFHTLKNSQRDLLKSIQHENGDLFAGFEWYFSRMIAEVFKGKNANFYRNLFMSMDYRSFHKSCQRCSTRCIKKTKPIGRSSKPSFCQRSTKIY